MSFASAAGGVFMVGEECQSDEGDKSDIAGPMATMYGSATKATFLWLRSGRWVESLSAKSPVFR